MATSPKLPMASGSTQGAYHVFHADAFILKGKIEEPIQQEIEPIGLVKLEHTRRNSLFTQSVGETNIEGVIYFRRGHTRVAGTHVQQKTDIFGNNHAGWVTLSSAVIEGYNVIDIITADRVVAQMTSEHAMTNDPNHPIEHVPRVNFLGSGFSNLRIGGFPVETELDLNICGPKPKDDRTYLLDLGFLDRVQRQLDSAAGRKDLPGSLGEQYSKEIVCIDDLRKRAKEGWNPAADSGANGYPKVRFSLVKTIRLPKEIPGVQAFGNQIFIQDYGSVALGEVEVGIHGQQSTFGRRKDDPPQSPAKPSTYFKLLMIETRMGCAYKNGGGGAGTTVNGSTFP